MLTIAIFDGEYDGDLSALTHLCDIAGSVVPDGCPAYPPLEEALQLLEMCADKYSTPGPSGDCLTGFIGRKIGDKVNLLARLDVFAHNGEAHASVPCHSSPRWDTEQVRYLPDDDVVTIVRKILKGNLRGGRE